MLWSERQVRNRMASVLRTQDGAGEDCLRALFCLGGGTYNDFQIRSQPRVPAAGNSIPVNPTPVNPIPWANPIPWTVWQQQPNPQQPNPQQTNPQQPDPQPGADPQQPQAQPAARRSTPGSAMQQLRTITGG